MADKRFQPDGLVFPFRTPGLDLLCPTAGEGFELRLYMTGIVLAVSDMASGRVVLLFVNAPKARSSRYDQTKKIEAHHPWLVACREDLVEPSREPTEIFGTAAAFRLDGEVLRLELPSAQALTPDPADALSLHLDDVCGHMAIDPQHVTATPGSAVHAQVSLPPCSIEVVNATPQRFSFDHPCPDVTPKDPRYIGHVGGVTIPAGDDASPIHFSAEAFGGGTREGITLRKRNGGTAVLVACVPDGALEQYLKMGGYHAIQSGPDLDFELYYDLTIDPPKDHVTVPIGHGPPAPAMPQVGNCPYAVGTIETTNQ